MPPLTTHDTRILQTLFDTEPTTTTTDGDNTITIDPTLPPYPAPSSSTSPLDQPNPVLISQINNPNPKLLQTLHHREISIISQLHPTTSSTETIKTAIAGFDALIGDYPWLASAYVNRAQGLRLLVDVGAGAGADADADAGKGTGLNQSYGLLDPSNSTLVSRIFDDLGRAIVLSTPASAGEGGGNGNGNENGDGTRVSPTQARILADAHTHRGYLLLRAARLKEANAKKAKNLKAECTCTTKSEIGSKPGSGSVFESESKPGGLGSGKQHTGSWNGQEEGCYCRVLDKEPQRLEELASRDFFLGGRYGNRVAGELAVRTNPYAKMCGEIVRGAMGRETG